jgi:hypothetical protein
MFAFALLHTEVAAIMAMAPTIVWSRFGISAWQPQANMAQHRISEDTAQ